MHLIVSVSEADILWSNDWTDGPSLPDCCNGWPTDEVTVKGRLDIEVCSAALGVILGGVWSFSTKVMGGGPLVVNGGGAGGLRDTNSCGRCLIDEGILATGCIEEGNGETCWLNGSSGVWLNNGGAAVSVDTEATWTDCTIGGVLIIESGGGGGGRFCKSVASVTDVWCGGTR